MCRQVARALHEQDYWELPLRKRIGMRIHVALCLMCGPYHRQVLRMQDMARRFLRQEEAPDAEQDSALTPDELAGMKEALRRRAGGGAGDGSA
jgi:hypothetical protein